MNSSSPCDFQITTYTLVNLKCVKLQKNNKNTIVSMSSLHKV